MSTFVAAAKILKACVSQLQGEYDFAELDPSQEELAALRETIVLAGKVATEYSRLMAAESIDFDTLPK